MNIIGKSPINPIIFYSGKIAGYAIWIALLMKLIDAHVVGRLNPLKSLALLLILFSLIIIVTSLVNLGASTRLGLPDENTEFKTDGIYKFSRNPMYLGFNMLSIAAILYLHNPVVLILGLYSIFTYHLIICAEEDFLENRFNVKYQEYKRKVRRYI